MAPGAEAIGELGGPGLSRAIVRGGASCGRATDSAYPRPRLHAEEPASSERAVQRILADLIAEGYLTPNAAT
jgi:hypothetical protein